MDYKKLAEECLALVGGKENVQSVTHCATRLRFQLSDRSKADIGKLEALDGVLGVKEVGAQTQIIIGPSVREVYKNLPDMAETGSEKASGSKESEKKDGAAARIMDTVSGIFAPIIPLITGAGMVKAVLALLVLFGMSNQSQEYYIINFIADSAFYFFPVILAFSSANKFGCNQYLAAMVGGVLLHPNWSALVSAGEAVRFFGLPVKLFSYSSSVLPIILTVWFMSYVEKFAEKYSPNAVKAILRPLVTLAVTAPVALIVIAPLGSYIGGVLAVMIKFLDTNIPVLVPTLVGMFLPFLVFVGMHLAIFPPLQTVQLADMGYETVCGPGSLACNMSIAGVTLAVALKSRNKKIKEIASSAGVTALCGITEPALYGCVFKLKKTVISAMIGGGVGGLTAGLLHLKRYALATPGIPALPTFIGEDPGNIFKAVAVLAVSVIVGFLATMVIGFDDELKAE